MTRQPTSEESGSTGIERKTFNPARLTCEEVQSRGSSNAKKALAFTHVFVELFPEFQDLGDGGERLVCEGHA